jgi:hypothetical protein
MIAQKSLAPTIALPTDNVSMVFALVKMDGVVLIVLVDALDMASVAVEMENVLKANVIATLVGLGMLAILEPVCMIVPNTAIATTELACAKRDTADVIVLFPRSLNLASVPFIACAAVCNSAPKFMRPKELVLPMSATQLALRNVCLSASLERCQSTSAGQQVCPLSLSTLSPAFKNRW